MTESATAAPTSDAGAGSTGASEALTSTTAPTDDAAKVEAAKQERISRAFLQAQRKQAEALREKSALAAEREAFQREKADIEAHKAKLEKFRSAADPTELLGELGVDYMELTRRIAEADTPEGKIKYLESAIRAQQEEFKQYLESQKAERERAENETKSQASERQWAEAVSQFTSYVTANEDKYPNLSLYAPDRISAAARAVAEGEFERVHGRPHRDGHEIAAYLEKLASEDISGLEQRKAKRSSKVTGAAPAASQQPQQSPISTSKLGTLTNKSAATTAAPSDASIDSFDDRRKRALERMKAARNSG